MDEGQEEKLSRESQCMSITFPLGDLKREIGETPPRWSIRVNGDSFSCECLAAVHLFNQILFAASDIITCPN